MRLRAFCAGLVCLATIVGSTGLPAGSALGPRPAAAADPGMVIGNCEPVGPLDVTRDVPCKRLLYRYGPLAVTPGDNLILLGPVPVEKPSEEGWIVRFRPDLVRITAEGREEIPGVDEIHLHHAVWISSAHRQPMISSGEEKTIKSFPNNYGLHVRPTDSWLLNYMLHNQWPTPETVYVIWTIDFVPKSGLPAGATMRDIEPIWLNVGGFNGANPVYNTKRGFGSATECSFPAQTCADADPYGRTPQGESEGNGLGHEIEVGTAGTIVYMDGHVHPGGLRMESSLRRGSQVTPAFVSDAEYFDPNGPVSWDMATEATRPDFRLQVKEGDVWIVNSVYETALASWYEGMGIIHYFIDPLGTEGKDPFGPQWNPATDPHNAGITHGQLQEATTYGGPDNPGAIVDGPPIGARVVTIQGFQYVPGGSGTEPLGIPAVVAGQTLRFVNLDAPEQVFHTVTSCKAPCNGPPGISYPLANGPQNADFDSLELGFGPRGLTPAANRADYALSTAGMDPGRYTYFCRIHPFMRGSFTVTAE